MTAPDDEKPARDRGLEVSLMCHGLSGPVAQWIAHLSERVRRLEERLAREAGPRDE